MDAFGPERVLFGTDSSFTWGVLSEKDFVTAIKDLATKAPDDAKFTQNEIEMLLGANAKKLLNV
jgi:predicted TIM-barrel fold metal-dependent hydrolase